MSEAEKTVSYEAERKALPKNVEKSDGVRPDLLQCLPEDLDQMEIDELYRKINGHLDQRRTIDKFRDHVAFKAALVMGWLNAIKTAGSMEGASYQEVNAAVMGSEGEFLDKLDELGVHVEIRSELSPERLAAKPQLFMSTHQGGGLETYLLAELMRRGGVKQFRYVMKDSNVKLPLGVGKTIASRGPILVHREQLRENREAEIQNIAQEIVENLAAGESVLFFFEGTRSKSGLIAHSEARQKWGTDLESAIKLAAKNYPGLDYGKVLVVLDMLSVLPIPVEKNPLGKVRMNGDCTATMVSADDLRFEVDLENNHDESTVFGKARNVLKKRLIERVQRYQGEAYSAVKKA